MILLTMPPVPERPPIAPVVLGVRPVAFTPVPRTVPPVPDLPANLPAAFLIMLPKFM